MKGEGSLKTEAQTTEKQQETQGLCKKPSNQHTPRGNNTRCATTAH